MNLRPGSPNAVIFGGSGFIGSHLIENLSDLGWSSLVLDIEKPRALPPGAKFRFCDVRRPIDVQLDSAPEAVFNLAAVHRTPGHPDIEYFQTNVAGAFNVTAWCDETAATSLIFTSSISVYGPSEEVKDERSPLVPTSAYGHSKKLAEEIHNQWYDRNADRRLVTVRPAVIFGQREQGNFTRLAGALQRRRFAYPGRNDTIKGCGYVKDLVRCLMFAATEVAAERTTYNFAYPTPYTIRDICNAFHDVAGYRKPPTIPEPMVEAGISTLQRFARTPLHQKLHPDRIRKLIVSTNIAPRVLMELGFPWKTDLELALRDWHVDSMRAGTGDFA